MKILSTTLKLGKSTKGTHVYENQEHKLSLYFPKDMFPDPEKPPVQMTITLDDGGVL